MKSSYQTPARRALLALFAANPDRHFTAEQICALLCDTGSSGASIGKSTVYRQLTRLCEQKKLRRFEDVTPDGDAVHVYQYAADAHCDHHFHLKCLLCGQVFHLECDQTDALLTHVRAAHQFAVDCGSSILYGRCAACQALDPQEDCHDHD